MTPIHFTGDITILPAALRPVSLGDACKVGLHIIFPGQWLVEDRGLRVKTEAEFRQWQAEREVEETLWNHAEEMAA